MLFLPVPFLSLRGRYGGLTASSEICSTSTTVTSLLSKRKNKEKDTTSIKTTDNVQVANGIEFD